MSARRTCLAIVAVVVSLTGSLLFVSASAMAVGFSPLASFSPPGGFGEPVGVAVDNSAGPDKGDVYVSDRGKDVVDEFSPTGGLLAQASVPGAGLGELAVAEAGPFEGDVYVVGHGNGVIYRFDPGLASENEVITGLEGPTGISTERSSGSDLYISEEITGKVLRFGGEGEPCNLRGCSASVQPGENVLIEGLDKPGSLACDFYYPPDQEELFVDTRSGTVAVLLNAYPTLAKTFAGVEATGVTGGPSPSGDVYVDERGPHGPHSGMEIAEYTPPGILGAEGDQLMATAGFESLSNEAFGVSVNNESGDIYVADGGHKLVYIFEPSPSSVTVATHSATVSTVIEPKGLPTTYYVEYGRSIPYESKTTPVSAGAGDGSVAVTIPLTGLTPGTKYHMRVVAVNEAGTKPGGDVAFVTYIDEVSGLPDGRVYELVSQFGNQYSEAYLPYGEAVVGGEPGVNGSIMAKSGVTYEASDDGDVMTFGGSPYNTGGTGDTEGNPNQYLASRLPQGGWKLANITPLGSYYSPYEGFTNDLSVGILNAKTETPFITTEIPHERPHVIGESKLSYSELYTRVFSEADFRPVFTGSPYRPSSTENTGENENGELNGKREVFYVKYAGSSPNGFEQLVESNEDLLEGDGRFEEELSSEVQKEGEEAKEASELSVEIEDLKAEAQKLEEEEKYAAAKTKYLERNKKRAQREVDEESDHNNKLYAVTAGKAVLVNLLPGETIAQNATFGSNLDHIVSADGSRIFWTSETGTIYVREDASKTVQISQGPAEFWTASLDGKYAFYTEAGKLWRFDVESEARVELAGSNGGVQGVIGTNETGEDGAYVYFVAQEILTSEENAENQQAVEGLDNLYVYEPNSAHPGQSKITFIGTLSPRDGADWATGLAGRLTNLTPDGHGLVFDSFNNLSGAAYPGEGANQEVYVYDADNASVICASCRPQASGGHLTPSLTSTRTYRWISEDGDQVFFDSSAPLVGQDINGKQDVYEWERDGSNGCEEDDGCVYLLSNGVEGSASLIDSSTSGNDVFIATRQRLIPELGNENEQIYDARVDGVMPVTPPQCSGTGCQGAPAGAPVFATPASVTFEGIGNFSAPVPAKATSKAKSLTRIQKLARALSACRKKRGKKQRAACEARAQKLYGAKAKTKAATRRAK